MKRLLLALYAAVMLTPSEAQTVVPASEGVATQSAAPMLMFGYISYQGVLTSMPEYTVAQENIKRLKAKYEEEAQRVEKDFNAKYESFLEGQRDFPKSILEKRQMELQELMTKNIAFKEESKRLLEMAERDAMSPLYDTLNAVLKMIAEDKKLAFIINTDNNACPYSNPTQGIDLNDLVKATLCP